MLVTQRKIRQVNKAMRKQQGFTLMEVMIAAFVLAVGMLGSTAMMLRGMQQADNTNYEAVAVQLAFNMAERMRSNIRGVADGAYDSLNATTVNEDCTSSVCNSASVALYHAYIWGTELEDLLPNTNPTASVISSNPGTVDTTFRISVNWDASVKTSSTTGTVQTRTYVMIFQP